MEKTGILEDETSKEKESRIVERRIERILKAGMIDLKGKCLENDVVKEK